MIGVIVGECFANADAFHLHVKTHTPQSFLGTQVGVNQVLPCWSKGRL